MISILLTLASLATTSAPHDILQLGTASGAWSYPYGGKTHGEISSGKDGRILSYSGDDREYSGWTLHLPKNLDLAGIRSQGSLKIKVRGGVGGEDVFVGLMDDESDGPGKKVQVRLAVKNFAPLDKTWKVATIPLSEFENQGSWWDDKAKQEISGRFDWTKVAEVRISSNMGANGGRTDSTGMFKIEVGAWNIEDSCQGCPAASAAKPVAARMSNEIRWNHLGYAPNGTKRFVLANPTDSVFSLLDGAGKSVYDGKLAAAGLWDASDETISQGEFTGWRKPGTYSIVVGKAKSQGFKIDAGVYSPALRDAVRAFYFQRASTELPETLVGIWHRGSGHGDTGLSLVEAGRDGTWSAKGGWYDAGDYGKYTLNGAVSVGILLQAYDLYPELFGDNTKIPESGNGKPDLVDECIWELDWMTRMQDVDGGLFFKIASKQWDGMTMPDRTSNPRFVIGKSTTASLTFAAAAAQASRLLKKLDPARSKDYLARAEKAWAWAQKNPAVREPRETGGSGPYEDSRMADEFIWAATELWLATEKTEYRKTAKSGFDTVAILQTTSWQNVQNLAYYEIALHGGKDALATLAKTRIDSMAGAIRKQIDENPYRTPLQGFPWASNDVAMQKAAVLAMAERFKPGSAGSGIQESVDYVLGKNATGRSFVTGTGELSARNPHHRVMSGDGVAEPFPGFMVGGPNADRQDDIKKAPWGVAYDHTEPAKCWMDTDKSYASNEVAINWNAAYVFALAALEHQLKAK